MARSQRDSASSLEELRRAVETGERRGYYLLHGDEDFGRERMVSWLTDALAPDAVDFNSTPFHGDRVETDEFLRVYYSYPMMSSHRLLVLKACDKLTVDQCRTFEQVIQNPSETSILLATGGKVDMRRKLFQQMARLGHSAEFRSPYDNRIGQWISGYAGELKVVIEPKAVDLLRLYIGNNLRELAGEIEKLQTYLGPGNPITADAVNDVVAASDSGGIFALADSIGGQDYPKCQRLLHDILARGEDPGRILAMVVRHYKLLLRTRDFMSGASNSRKELASHLGVAPFFVENYAEQASRYNSATLWRAMSDLLKADHRIRTLGRRQQVNIMEVMLFNLCGRRA